MGSGSGFSLNTSIPALLSLRLTKITMIFTSAVLLVLGINACSSNSGALVEKDILIIDSKQAITGEQDAIQLVLTNLTQVS